AASSADDNGQLPRLSCRASALSPRHGLARRREYGAELLAQRHIPPSSADLSAVSPGLTSPACAGAAAIYRCRLTFPPPHPRSVATALVGRPDSAALLAPSL